MSATLSRSSSPTPELADVDATSWSKEGADQKVDFASYSPVVGKEVELELEYATRVFPLEGDRKLHASKPLRFAYFTDAENGTETVEIVGWNLEVDLGEASDLPRQIARRFLQLFSDSQSGTLSEHDEACFGAVCAQIDYRRFCAERDLPRYTEACLVRKTPPLIRHLGSPNIRLAPEVGAKIELVDEGEYFGGDFTLDREGNIIDIANVVLLPSPEEILADDDPERYRLDQSGVPQAIRDLLPKRELGSDCVE